MAQHFMHFLNKNAILLVMLADGWHCIVGPCTAWPALRCCLVAVTGNKGLDLSHPPSSSGVIRTLVTAEWRFTLQIVEDNVMLAPCLRCVVGIHCL